MPTFEAIFWEGSPIISFHGLKMLSFKMVTVDFVKDLDYRFGKILRNYSTPSSIKRLCTTVIHAVQIMVVTPNRIEYLQPVPVVANQVMNIVTVISFIEAYPHVLWWLGHHHCKLLLHEVAFGRVFMKFRGKSPHDWLVERWCSHWQAIWHWHKYLWDWELLFNLASIHQLKSPWIGPKSGTSFSGAMQFIAIWTMIMVTNNTRKMHFWAIQLKRCIYC